MKKAEVVLATLGELEAVIEGGLRTFVEVGAALLEIRDRRLYREQGFKTFEDYCQERWKWSRRHVNRQIEAAGVVRNLGPMGPTVPENERQARQLVPLPPEEQREVWKSATANGKVSIRELTRLVRERMAARGITPPPEPRRSRMTKEQEREWDARVEETRRNDEHNVRLIDFVHAIETLARPPFPIRQAAREIRKMDSPDKNWCGLASVAEKNLCRLIQEMKS